MNSNQEGIILNYKFYTKERITNLCKEKLSDNISEQWGKDIYSFIYEWFNENKYITVKTSGSTGTPMSVSLDKSKMINSALMTGRYFNPGKESNALLCLPANYIAGKMMIVRAIIWEMNLVTIKPSSDPLSGIGLNEKIDFAAMVPLQLINILNNNKKDIYKLNNIKTLIIGGGRVPNILRENIKRLSTKVYETYGMTETITHIAVKPLNNEKSQSYFQVLPGITISDDKRGCLVIDAPDISEKKIVTNDLVKIIDKDKFEWSGRYDNIVNSGGVKIIPERIEEKLSNIINEDFFISSLPDDKLGNKVILVIEKKAIGIKEKNTIFKNIRTVLPKHHIAKEIYAIPIFKRTPNGKILRKETLIP